MSAIILIAAIAAAVAFAVGAIILGVSYFAKVLIFAPYKRPPLAGGYQLWGTSAPLTPDQQAKANAIKAELGTA